MSKYKGIMAWRVNECCPRTWHDDEENCATCAEIVSVNGEVESLQAQLAAAREEVRMLRLGEIPRYMMCNEHPFVNVTDPMGANMECFACRAEAAESELKELRAGVEGMRQKFKRFTPGDVASIGVLDNIDRDLQALLKPGELDE